MGTMATIVVMLKKAEMDMFQLVYNIDHILQKKLEKFQLLVINETQMC